jgi:hypothetical protein
VRQAILIYNKSKSKSGVNEDLNCCVSNYTCRVRVKKVPIRITDLIEIGAAITRAE